MKNLHQNKKLIIIFFSLLPLPPPHPPQNLPFSHHRSKSRSVDHGLAAPFANLDSLRSTVEGRFDSVERLSKGLFFIDLSSSLTFVSSHSPNFDFTSTSLITDKLKGSLPAIPTTIYTVNACFKIQNYKIIE